MSGKILNHPSYYKKINSDFVGCQSKMPVWMFVVCLKNKHSSYRDTDLHIHPLRDHVIHRNAAKCDREDCFKQTLFLGTFLFVLFT